MEMPQLRPVRRRSSDLNLVMDFPDMVSFFRVKVKPRKEASSDFTTVLFPAPPQSWTTGRRAHGNRVERGLENHVERRIRTKAFLKEQWQGSRSSGHLDKRKIFSRIGKPSFDTQSCVCGHPTGAAPRELGADFGPDGLSFMHGDLQAPTFYCC